jgi:hypothetical protein
MPGFPFRFLRLAGAAAAFALVLLAVPACDSGSDPPEPRFQATFEGDVQKTIEGPAGMTDSETLNQQLQSTLPLVLSLLPDSIAVPDSLLDPDDAELPDGTAMFFAAPTEGGYGDGFSFFFPGDGVPDPGTYEPGSLPDGTGGALPPLVVYTRYEDGELLLAPIVDGTVEVQDASERRLRGRFEVETGGAAVAPLGEADAGSLRVDPFETTINGRFTATPDEQIRPPLPFLGGLALGAP